jgi:hypothetical protein
MNLVSAIQSGKPFKRPHYEDWIVPNPHYVDQSLFGMRKNTEGNIDDQKWIISNTPFMFRQSKKLVLLSMSALLAIDYILED